MCATCGCGVDGDAGHELARHSHAHAHAHADDDASVHEHHLADGTIVRHRHEPTEVKSRLVRLEHDLLADNDARARDNRARFFRHQQYQGRNYALNGRS